MLSGAQSPLILHTVSISLPFTMLRIRFAALSGGQKSKAELVRSVFFSGTCPKVLLVDETLAPLDPVSKRGVMAKLKEFCRDSLMLVIYHSDSGDGAEVKNCVPAQQFFDGNIHFENSTIMHRQLCDSI